MFYSSSSTKRTFIFLNIMKQNCIALWTICYNLHSKLLPVKIQYYFSIWTNFHLRNRFIILIIVIRNWSITSRDITPWNWTGNTGGPWPVFLNWWCFKTCFLRRIFGNFRTIWWSRNKTSWKINFRTIWWSRNKTSWKIDGDLDQYLFIIFMKKKST